MSSSSLLNNVSINKANVQDANISDLTTTKLESTTANISDLTTTKLESTTANISGLTVDNLTVDNLTTTKLDSTTANISDLTVDNLTVNNITDATPDYDVIVVGGGIAGITAAIYLAENLSNKKVGLFTDANKQTDLEFYKTLIYRPSELPDSNLKEQLIKEQLINDINQVGGGVCGLANSIVGGYSFFNTNGWKNSKDNVYNIVENRNTDVFPGNFNGGGLPYSRNIGGLLNMSGGVAILDEEYYKNSDLDYLLELEEFKNMYDLITIEDIADDKTNKVQSEIATAVKNSVLDNSGLYFHKNGLATEKSNYNKCGRIHFQKKLNDATNNHNLIVNYGCEVNNLNIIQKDNKNICDGIYVNGKFISSKHIILSAGIPGTPGLLQTANNSIPTKPLKDFSGNFKENPYIETLLLIPNALDKFNNTYSKDNYTNNIVLNSVSKSKTDVYNNPSAENYFIQSFNLEFGPHILTLATLLIGLPNRVYTNYSEFILLPEAATFVTILSQIGQKTIPDTSLTGWSGGYKPVGYMVMNLLIFYPPANTSILMDHTKNSCTISNEKTMNQISNVENPLSTTTATPLSTYSFVNGMLKYNITYEYLKFKNGVSEEQQNKYLTDYKNFMISLTFGETSVRYNLYKNFSQGYYVGSDTFTPFTSDMVDGIPVRLGSTPIVLTQTIDNKDFQAAIYKSGNYTWHGTEMTSEYINKHSHEFNDIVGLYSGDQCAWPVTSPSSTGIFSACCGLRAANAVISSLNN
jgi:hypothetical protein